ncbi:MULTISPECIES: M13 family metallopeptidase [Caulobacter]|jgi:putative endopeptidase|uniref:Putative metalloendopeptidase n=1 Tax=Caulobacter vibrioides OR37 TaxID=1292034 RepID=R0ELA6_CAUVI|nr:MULTISPECIES: M13 family metallopeptidase [Caulobacter]ENZ81902.1 putative metalloendopeptidase [Caulobacter vibrioides OR37]MBQ1559583.1 M13 family metallopeptidase [Caulobacter sp.]
MRIFLLAAVSAVAISGAALAADKPMYGAWGVDLTARDTAVKPGDDFNKFANGSWEKRTTIPADQPSAGVGYDVFNRSQDQLRTLIETAPANTQIGGLYKSFTDEAKVEQVDDAPLKADLARIAAIATKADMAKALGAAHGGFGSDLFSLDIYPDAKTPELNVLYIGQSGLGLPDRDYYLTDGFKPQLEAYRAFAERALKMAGAPDPAKSAADVIAFETAIAKVSWPVAERRDVEKTYNPMTIAELQASAPEIPWSDYLAAAGAPSLKSVVLGEKTAVRDIAKLFAATPLETLKAWQTVQGVQEMSPYLSKRFVDSRFEFVKVLSGQTQLRPRWKRGVTLVDGSLGELVGQAYVAKYFPPSSKAQMVELIGNLKVAMAARIEKAPWMAPATKQAALTKLSKMRVMVGYPDKWRDYSGLKIDAGDLYGNVRRSGAFEWAYQLSDLGKPVDHGKWGMTPQTVNAYNGGLENKIVFPAGILQAPFFDPAADPAVNYGAIGAVIGHEISHGFDDQGRKIDDTGKLRDWWTAEDAKRFEAQSSVLGAQYDSYEAVPGMHINGQLTMGENIADLAGLQVAYDAYHAALKGKPAPVIDGMTGDQRFFLAFAQAWQDKSRDDSLKQQMASDPHSPSNFRVIGPTRNVDAWYAAFGVKPGDKFYLPPEKRSRIW